MRITCDIAMDLAGLYTDRLASKDSVAAIRQHLRGCPSCCRYYREFARERKAETGEEGLPPEDHMQLYTEFSERVRRRRRRSIAAVAAAVSLGAGMLITGLVFYEKYLSGKEK